MGSITGMMSRRDMQKMVKAHIEEINASIETLGTKQSDPELTIIQAELSATLTLAKSNALIALTNTLGGN